ncbi:MAG TPA: cellobiose phosphorylase, partial [Bacillota bacterium]
MEQPERTNYLYFPLANDSGMISAVTPLLHGDLKTGQNSFLLAPVTAEDLHNSRSARNFWIFIEEYGAWSVGGNSPRQMMLNFSDTPEAVTLEAGLLWHKITRTNPELGITAEITNFVPATADTVELMRVRITNTGSAPVRFTPTAAIPIYGRSATNIRDHRHVTSLLHRIRTTPSGVVVKPTFCFDERGHLLNRTNYGVFGVTGTGGKPVGFFPKVESFIGAGGSFEWPEAVVRNRVDFCRAGEEFAGWEAVGAIRFREESLEPGASCSYIMVMTISEAETDLEYFVEKFGTDEAFEQYLRENKAFWDRKLSSLVFNSGDSDYSNWLRWVGIQPILRRICGCSFLP